MEHGSALKLDLMEKGAPKEGKPTRSDRRLFMLFQAFTNCHEPQAVADTFENSGLTGAVYRDVHDRRGIGIVVAAEDPSVFTHELRDMLVSWPFDTLVDRPRYRMMGRTYSLGYETDLDEALVERPLRHMLTPDWPWAIWYPLRRKGSFETLTPEEQSKILREHAEIGMAFGKGNLAHDVRLACHGLDPDDNDFVIGLTGKALYPLSACIQRMRKTIQTSQYLEKLGPFFIGEAIAQVRGNL